MENAQNVMDILSLPTVMIEHILSFLSYDEIAKNRIVCKGFNDVCKRMLNRGFVLIERHHACTLKNVKAQLPRRESERRHHPLSRHCDILTSVETRISMLNMTYSKFIDNGLCCFIPGKVIDEIRRVLKMVDVASTPPRAHEVLQELRDISSMAIEHFDDKISPVFRKKLQTATANEAAAGQGMLSDKQPGAQCPLVYGVNQVAVRLELAKMNKRYFVTSQLSLYLSSQFKRMLKKLNLYRKAFAMQNETIRRMRRTQREQDKSLAEMKRRIDECDIKYNELTQTNQAAGGKAINESPTPDVSPPSGQSLRNFASQIKLDLSVKIGTSKRSHGKVLPNIMPRKPVIKLPALLDADTSDEPPVKQAKVNRTPSPVPSTSKSQPTTSVRTKKLNKMLRAKPQAPNSSEVKGFFDYLLTEAKSFEKPDE